MNDSGAAVMAKKKADRHPDKWNVKPIVMQLRGTTEYKKWLEDLAEFDATTVAEMAERAFAAYARQIGFTGQRPKR